ncbi:hypothetical protein IWQ62_004420 [Dispira parvispora]|uniref:Metal-dependent protein hydrolase n=1 Tax=Dispira parvispora TaxID=1520584 RepID=A0A9W8ASX7_9FUNG|nr:hypothetical protein IWQ62_004420 [Dispira parvispora]
MPQKTIGTHNGTFHCDEALAVYLLTQTSKFADAQIVRTRDSQVLATCDAVVDVGGVYDADAYRFDHHQRGFEEVFSKHHTTKLSSAGLVYKHFGREIIAQLLNLDEESVETLYTKLYDDFVEALDAIDNGISQYPKEVEPRYKDSTHLAARVGRLNPWWNQPDTDLDARFHRAMALAGSEFTERVRYFGLAWLPAYDLVYQAVKQREAVDPQGKIVVLETPCPWKDHIYAIEEKLHLSTPILYVLYPDTANGNWRVQAVPVSNGSFESRKPLPESWRGCRDSELSEKTKLPGCVFIHASGFIGGHQTKDGALALARKALEL